MGDSLLNKDRKKKRRREKVELNEVVDEEASQTMVSTLSKRETKKLKEHASEAVVNSKHIDRRNEDIDSQEAELRMGNGSDNAKNESRVGKESSYLVETDKSDKKKKKKKKKKKDDTLLSPAKDTKDTGEDSEVQHPARSTMLKEKFLSDNQIRLSGPGNEKFHPIFKFSESNFPPAVDKVFSSFEKPTPIQSQCWPILLAGRHLIGIAETGSGKTLAFVLPGIKHLMESKKSSTENISPKMLVVAPTRELAMQVAGVLGNVCEECGLKSVCLYGGVSKQAQRQALKGKPDAVVGTPGRMIDLIREGSMSLSNVSYVVLDEADRMLDDGFEKDIRDILQQVHRKRQMVMFSATWPESIQKLASEFLTSPIQVTVGSPDLSANRRITQIVEVIDERKRDTRLLNVLQKYHSSKTNRVLVFVLYKKEAVRIEGMLRRNNWKCAGIHGDKSQADRSEAVEQFKSGNLPLLVATDVAARGLDIPDVEFVVNYSFPLTIEDYIHRIGRTGRAGKRGTAHTFFHSGDKPRAGELVNVLREAEQTVPEELLKFGTHVKKKEHKLYGAFAKAIDVDKKASKIVFDSD